MRLGDRRKITPENVSEIIELKKQGWSFVKLAAKFDVDHSSIIYWVRKNGILPNYFTPKTIIEKEMADIPCKNCGKIFRQKSNRQKFCEKRCYIRYYYNSKKFGSDKIYRRVFKESENTEFIRDEVGHIVKIIRKDLLPVH